MSRGSEQRGPASAVSSIAIGSSDDHRTNHRDMAVVGGVDESSRCGGGCGRSLGFLSFDEHVDDGLVAVDGCSTESRLSVLRDEH